MVGGSDCLKYPPPHHQFPTITDFARQVLLHQGVKKVVDVWCEAPMTMGWLDVVGALAGLEEEGFSYHFVVGQSSSDLRIGYALILEVYRRPPSRSKRLQRDRSLRNHPRALSPSLRRLGRDRTRLSLR